MKRWIARASATVCSIALIAVAAAPASSQAAPARCEGLIIKSAEIVTDQGQIGVLDAGDVFTVTFQRPFWAIFAPGSVVGFTAADGQEDFIFHSSADFDYTVTSRRSVTVTIREIDLGGEPVDIALPLPVSITTFSGLVDKKGNELDRTVSTCSPDAVLG